MSRRVLPLVAIVVALMAAVPAFAISSSDPVEQPARAKAPAVRATPRATDVVTIYNSGELRRDVADKAAAAARAAGASASIGRSASIGMTALRRGSSMIQQPPAGYAYPMGATVLSPETIAQTMGGSVSAVLGPDAIVMGSVSAGMRGAKAGDTIDLTAASGGTVRFRIAMVLDDVTAGGAEMIMTNAAADRLGLSRLSRVVITGIDSRSALDNAMRAQGLVSTSIRIRRSWDPADPDDTLGMAATKALLGEFAYRVNGDGSVTQEAAWQAAHLPSGRELLSSAIPIRARCHNTVKPDIQAALAEVAAAGLGGTINVGHANLAGGCHYPRFNRLTPNSAVGFLSRHSWGMALDTNTIGSCQGCVPDFSKTAAGCRTIQIFRKHGFAWGGNFLTPDGMHFEWVGERRDQLAYPSRFCPNNASALTSELTVEQTERATLFAHDGLASDDDH